MTKINELLKNLEDRLEGDEKDKFKKELLNYLKSEESKWKSRINAGVDPQEYKVLEKIIHGITAAEAIVNEV